MIHVKLGKIYDMKLHDYMIRVSVHLQVMMCSWCGCRERANTLTTAGGPAGTLGPISAANEKTRVNFTIAHLLNDRYSSTHPTASSKS